MKNPVLPLLQIVGLAITATLALFASGLVIGERPVHALPEYVDRTGEPCSTCHVNPGGGGPRTLRGLLWASQGRPDAVPLLSDILIAPGATDGVELYDIACAACHGTAGEGLFGTALTSAGLDESKIESTILRGRERSGMPAYAGQFTPEQLEILVTYVAGLASGQIEPAPASYPLPPGQLECDAQPESDRCGGN